MRLGPATAGAVAAGLLALGATTAPAKQQDTGHNRQAIDTRADFTPGVTFTPLASSSPCTGAGLEDPFVTPPEIEQAVFAQEPNPNHDDWDMHTQNEFGVDAGRYVYRTHEPGRDGAVSVTDLKTGTATFLAQRADWERFDGLVWTPWGTILAAEEVITQSRPDPQVPQAKGGLVYELFVDEDEPWKLDPSREPITPNDGTTDTTKDGIRARPALGAKSHEGMRFDRRGFHYGIAESRGETQPPRSGAIFRFVPDRKGDLSEGTLYALRTENGKYGEGTWVPLPDGAAEQDADLAAGAAGANRYERPEDVETGESTGKDRNNGQHTVYVAITDGVAEGVLALDTSKPDRPFAYPYVGKQAGNASEPAFNAPDNLALDREGNLAITEDPGGEPPQKTQGDDIWIAAPPKGGKHYRPASVVARFASLRDCVAEPSGVYFPLAGTERWSSVVTGESLIAHRMHAGQDVPNDQSVAFTPIG